MKFERILFPTDFSDHAAHAQKAATELASQFGADLHMLHVAPLYSYVVDFGMDNSGQYEAVLNSLREMMDALLDGLAEAPFSVTGTVIQGEPVKEIIGAAKSEGSDVIIVGTHGRNALEHVLLGSIAERVVRKSPCPVLTVPMPGHVFKMP